MSGPVRQHYQEYPYPHFPLFASVCRSDTYAINLDALWCRFNGCFPPEESRRILLAGCGTFSPYPFSISNPDAEIVALDLSERSLKRARLHSLLHRCRNISFLCGDLLETSRSMGRFGLIDAFGVLHHLDDPLAGLKVLGELLLPGGVLRIMVYSRYARKEEESIRRSLRLLGISSPEAARRLFRRAAPGSRLGRYLAASDETGTDPGLADALLHPCVHTFRIDGLMEMIGEAGLRPLLFAHPGAVEDPDQEIARLRMLDKERRSPGNFVLYLGKNAVSGANDDMEPGVVLNPCLTTAVGLLRFGGLHVPPRIGCENPLLGHRERVFLRRFTVPVPRRALSLDQLKLVDIYKRPLFLLECLIKD